MIYLHLAIEGHWVAFDCRGDWERRLGACRGLPLGTHTDYRTMDVDLHDGYRQLLLVTRLETIVFLSRTHTGTSISCTLESWLDF